MHKELKNYIKYFHEINTKERIELEQEVFIALKHLFEDFEKNYGDLS